MGVAAPPPRRPWFYFGCVRESGHYLFTERLQREHSGPFYGLARFDGSLCPPVSAGLYVAALTRLGGPDYSALAFWDQTVDRRSNSNSIIFAPGLVIHPLAIWKSAEKLFPAVISRLPPVSLDLAVAQHEKLLAAYRPVEVAA